MAEISESENGQVGSIERAKQYGGAPIVFKQETSLFGKRKPEKTEWLKHTEVYGSLANIIDPSHITGLQRVNGMWRIYTDNLDNKVALLDEGILLRGKRVKLLNTNPNRLDSEPTIRIRVKNIPLSVDDGLITRPLILKDIDIINCMREKLRYNGRLTNCETGDRLVTVKATSLKTPLPRTMMFGKFVGRVLHYGQNAETKVEKCRKCLEEGHSARSCPNDWKCLLCAKSGHRKGDCDMSENRDPPTAPLSSNVLDQSLGDSQTKGNPITDVTADAHEEQQTARRETKSPRKKSKKKKATEATKGQQSIKNFCATGSETPNTEKKPNVKNRTPPTPEDASNETKKTRRGNESSSDSDSSSEDETA